MAPWQGLLSQSCPDQLCDFQFSSVAQSCPTLYDPMDCSMPGFPVHHLLPEFTQTHGLRVSDAIQPSHPLSSPSPPTFNLSQHQSLFKWVSSFFASGDQSIVVSASASILPMNIHGWLPLGLTGLTSWQKKGLFDKNWLEPTRYKMAEVNFQRTLKLIILSL